MKRVKEVLVYHGEKLGFALVALLCLNSILGNLMQKPNELRLPGDETFVVEDEQIRQSLKNLEGHVKSNKVTVTPAAIPDIAREIEEAHRQWQRPCDAAFLWTFYHKPPKPLTLPPLPAPPTRGRDPDERWITAVQAIADYEVVAAAKKIAVICKAPEGIRWPKRGTVRVMLFRKYIGPAKENLDLKTAEKFRVRRAGAEAAAPTVGKPVESSNPYADLFGVKEEPGPKKSEPTKKKTAQPSFPSPDALWGPPMWPGPEGPQPPKTPSKMQPPKSEHPKPSLTPEKKDTAKRPPAMAEEEEESAEEDAEKEEKGAPEKSPAQKYVEQLASQIKRIKNDITAVVDLSSAEASGWSLVCADMPCFLERPSVEAILLKGKLPRETGREVEQDDPKPDKKDVKSDKTAKPEKVESPREDVRPASGFEGLLVEPARKRLEKDQDPGGEEQLIRKYKPGFVPRYYAYLDTDVEENAAYIYRFVVSVKARDIPWEMREREEYRDYALRVENADLSYKVEEDDQTLEMGYFAILEEEIKNFVKAEKPLVGIAEAEETQPLQFLSRIERDPKTRAVIGLRDSQGAPTKRGYAYASQRCYSLFTYSDLVLTPLEKRVILTTTAVSRDGGEDQRTASFKVEIMSGEKGKVSPLYTLPVPAATQNLDPLAWLRRGADGKPLWPEGVERPEILSLAEYYAKVEDLEPVPIGKRETIGKEEWDFSSGWALVDVRVCTVMKYRYRVDEDGKRVVLGKPQESQDTYAVICETKEKNPRYKRLPRNRPASAEAEDVVVEYEYIWEPALEKWIQQERSKRSAKKEEAVKKAEEAAARDRKQDKGEVSQSKE